MSSALRVIFMGTPALALPSLEKISKQEELVAVVAQPDRPAGRGKKLKRPPVAEWASAHHIPLLQPESMKGFAAKLASFKPDLILVVAYGIFLPKEVLTLPTLKTVNLHFSLLPKYRGAAPVQHALLNGEKETGVTTFFIVEKMDAGPILIQEKVAISCEDSLTDLWEKLSQIGAELLLKTTQGLKNKTLKSTPQDEAQASLAPALEKEEGKIDWSRSAVDIHNRVRAFEIWPTAYTFVDKKIFKLYSARVIEGSGKPGMVTVANSDILEVACGRGRLRIHEVQLAGKRRMSAREFLNGHPLTVGVVLGTH